MYHNADAANNMERTKRIRAKKKKKERRRHIANNYQMKALLNLIWLKNKYNFLHLDSQRLFFLTFASIHVLFWSVMFKIRTDMKSSTLKWRLFFPHKVIFFWKRNPECIWQYFHFHSWAQLISLNSCIFTSQRWTENLCKREAQLVLFRRKSNGSTLHSVTLFLMFTDDCW